MDIFATLTDVDVSVGDVLFTIYVFVPPKRAMWKKLSWCSQSDISSDEDDDCCIKLEDLTSEQQSQEGMQIIGEPRRGSKGKNKVEKGSCTQLERR